MNDSEYIISKAHRDLEEFEVITKVGPVRQFARSVVNARKIGQGNTLRAAAYGSRRASGSALVNRADLSTLSRRELKDANKIWRNQAASAARNPF